MYLLIPSIYVLLVIETNVFLFVPSLQPRHVVDFLLSGGIFPHIAWKSLKKSHLQHYKDTFMAILKHCVCIEMTQVTYEKNPGIFAKDIFISSQVSLSGQQ